MRWAALVLALLAGAVPPAAAEALLGDLDRAERAVSSAAAEVEVRRVVEPAAFERRATDDVLDAWSVETPSVRLECTRTAVGHVMTYAAKVAGAAALPQTMDGACSAKQKPDGRVLLRWEGWATDVRSPPDATGGARGFHVVANGPFG